MDPVWKQVRPVLERGETFILATVVATSSSSPREVGAIMAVMDDGSVLGSVSGGCVESDVYASAEEVRESGRPQMRTCGYTDNEAFEVGLTCGGTIHVYIEPIGRAAAADLLQVLDAAGRDIPAGTVTVVSGAGLGRRFPIVPQTQDEETGLPHEPEMLHSVREMISEGRSGLVDVAVGKEIGFSIFVHAQTVRARLRVFGTNDFAAALVAAGSLMDYHVTLCDARQTFATRERFPQADEIVVAWPHAYLQNTHTDRRTVLCVLTHDEKFDVPLLQVALRSPAGYVGAMGSRLTVHRRVESLRAAGLSATEVDRLRAPIGLDLGARTPAETAVSILAEVISEREQRSATRLADSTGPIHVSGPGSNSVCLV